MIITIRPDRKDELLQGLYGCRDGESRFGCAVAKAMALREHKVNLIVNRFKGKNIDNVDIHSTSDLKNLQSDFYLDTHWTTWRGTTNAKFTLLTIWTPLQVPYVCDNIPDVIRPSIPIVIYPYPHVKQNFEQINNKIVNIPFPYFDKVKLPNFYNKILFYISKDDNKAELLKWKDTANKFRLKFIKLRLGVNWEERDKLAKFRLPVNTFLFMLSKSKLVIFNGYPSGIPIECISNGTAVVSDNNILWQEKFDLDILNNEKSYVDWIVDKQIKYEMYSFSSAANKIESLTKTQHLW